MLGAPVTSPVVLSKLEMQHGGVMIWCKVKQATPNPETQRCKERGRDDQERKAGVWREATGGQRGTNKTRDE